MTISEAKEVFRLSNNFCLRLANIQFLLINRSFVGVVVYEVSVRMGNSKILEVSFVNLATKLGVLKSKRHIDQVYKLARIADPDGRMSKRE
jgi:hypothetical protein